MIVAAAVNIVLDLFFVLRLGLGIGGAAAATLIAQMVSCIFWPALCSRYSIAR